MALRLAKYAERGEGVRGLDWGAEKPCPKGFTKKGLRPVDRGARREPSKARVLCLPIREAGCTKAELERSGKRAPIQRFREAESTSASKAVEAKAQVKGKPTLPLGWLSTKRACRSKGSNREHRGNPVWALFLWFACR